MLSLDTTSLLAFVDTARLPLLATLLTKKLIPIHCELCILRAGQRSLHLFATTNHGGSQITWRTLSRMAESAAAMSLLATSASQDFGAHISARGNRILACPPFNSELFKRTSPTGAVSNSLRSRWARPASRFPSGVATPCALMDATVVHSSACRSAGELLGIAFLAANDLTRRCSTEAALSDCNVA